MRNLSPKNKLLKILNNLGGFHIARYFSQNSPRILMYHRFGPNSSRRLDISIFEKQIQILRKKFNIISLNSLCTSLINNDPLPPNAVIITIDDGYEDFYTYAYPILEKYSVPATIYVTTDFIDNKVWLWPDVIEFIFAKAQYNTYTIRLNGKEERYNLTTNHEQLKAWNDMADYCLTLKKKDKNEFIRKLASDLKVCVPPSPASEYKPLSWKQIMEIKKHGIDIGSHTCAHPRLVMLDDATMRYEIESSKKRIEDMTDDTVDSFCYPHGTKMDFNDDIKRMVRNAGYKNATVAFCDSNIMTDLFELRRYSIGRDMLRFKENIYGIKFLSNKIKGL